MKKPAIVVDVASLDEEEQSEDEHALQVSQRSIDDNPHCNSDGLRYQALDWERLGWHLLSAHLILRILYYGFTYHR